MNTTMLVIIILWFLVGVGAMIYMKTKGLGAKGSYAVAARQLFRQIYPALDIQQYEFLECTRTYSAVEMRIPVLIAYNSNEFFLIPATRNLTGTQLNAPDSYVDRNEHIPLLGIQQIGINDNGTKMAFVIKGKETILNFSKRNTFGEDQSQKVAEFLATMTEAANN